MPEASNAYRVRDIMTPAEVLQRADELVDAVHLLHEFDVVPYPRRGNITGFFQRGSSDCQPIRLAQLVSDSTNLLDLTRLLAIAPFYFVISGAHLIGYVHYSDLNKPQAKIPYFALFQAAEKRLWEASHHRVSETLLRQLFSDSEVARWLRLRAKITAGNTNVGWNGVFTFPYILRIARRCGVTDITDTDISLLKDVRNRVAHSDRNLVEGLDDVQALTRAQQLFEGVLAAV